MSPRIIVCDDEPHIVRAISLKFARAGFDVQGASDAESCWELLHRHTPALLITDYTMPGMNGAQLVRRIRDDATLADLPVILLTARGFELAEQTGELVGLGLSAMINKPFSPRELVVKVYEILGYEAEPSTAAYRDSFSSV
jgi:two-component system alkaline phosphatase synthesis response regulator PhoP